MGIGLSEVSSRVSQQVGRRGVQAASEQTKRAADAIARTIEKDSVSLGRNLAKPAADKTFEAAARRMDQMAANLAKTGNGLDGQMLKEFSSRLERARSLYAEGNTPAAYRMVHASEKLGLRNPEVQAAIKKGHAAEDVIAAFDKPAAKPGPKPAVKPPVSTEPVRPSAPEPTPAKPSVPVAKPAVKPFVLPGLGLDLSGLISYLNRLRAMFGLA
ncbi:MAG TPA: hypothetical protein V6D05_10005 [Stenomitos sp.]